MSLASGHIRTVRFGGELVLVAVLAACACGTLEPPIESESRGEQSSDASSARPLSVEPVRGRPQGLLLRLEASDTFESPSDRTIEIHRKSRDGESDVLESFQLKPTTVERLTGEGVTFLDRSIPSGEVYYQLRIAESESRSEGGFSDASPTVRAISSPLRVQWDAPPPVPARLRASSEVPVAVKLTWHPVGAGALIFRRNVLEQQSTDLEPVARLGSDSRGLFVDRDVRPGGVYAYRIALSRERERFVQYGEPSRTIYVSVPEERDH